MNLKILTVCCSFVEILLKIPKFYMPYIDPCGITVSLISLKGCFRSFRVVSPALLETSGYVQLKLADAITNAIQKHAIIAHKSTH